MKNKKKKFTNMVCTGLLAVLLIGCGNEVSVEGEVPGNAAAVSEVNEVQSMELQNTSAEEVKETENLNVNANGKSSFSSGEENEQQDLIDTAVKDFKHYFGLTIDLSQWEPEVSYMEAWEGFPALYLVDFRDPDNAKAIISVDENIDLNDYPTGYPTKEERQKSEEKYFVSYGEDKKVRDISVNYPKWEESQVPLSLGECKKIAEEFLKTKELVNDGKIEFITSKLMADYRAHFVYKNGAEGAIGIGINTYSSKVEDFGYLDKEAVEVIADPSSAANAVG